MLFHYCFFKACVCVCSHTCATDSWHIWVIEVLWHVDKLYISNPLLSLWLYQVKLCHWSLLNLLWICLYSGSSPQPLCLIFCQHCWTFIIVDLLQRRWRYGWADMNVVLCIYYNNVFVFVFTGSLLWFFTVTGTIITRFFFNVSLPRRETTLPVEMKVIMCLKGLRLLQTEGIHAKAEGPENNPNIKIMTFPTYCMNSEDSSQNTVQYWISVNKIFSLIQCCSYLTDSYRYVMFM